MSRKLKISAASARRIALAAQGFGIGRPDGAVNRGHVKRVIDRLGLLQIDSVNVLARAHYLPLFSRLGNYDSAHLDGLAWGRKSQRGLFEFWAHEASLLPLAAQPLLRWRMERAAAGTSKGTLQQFRREKTAYIEEVRRQVEARALLAPFDPLIWERDRTERIFHFFYRIEIYTPVAKRKHGYYVLPFLLGDRLVGRIDLKSDRANSKLLVPAAHLEPGIEACDVAAPMREELRLMADWLGLEGLALPRDGDLGREWRRMDT